MADTDKFKSISSNVNWGQELLRFVLFFTPMVFTLAVFLSNVNTRIVVLERTSPSLMEIKSAFQESVELIVMQIKDHESRLRDLERKP